MTGELLSPKQKLEDFIESGDTKTWPVATPWVARIEMIAALSALYIGDGLREIAQSINEAANPTGPDLDQEFENAVRTLNAQAEEIAELIAKDLRT